MPDIPRATGRAFSRREVLAGAAGLWAASGRPASSGARNIVLLMTDQQNGASVGLAGAPVRTPAMDRLAREGVVFSHAFCATPQCSPSRAALLTGRYPHRTGVLGNVGGGEPVPCGMSAPLDPRVPGLGSVFAQAGYGTAYFGKWHLGPDPTPHGWQTGDIRECSDSELTAKVRAFLTARSRRGLRAPLVIVVSWINPHDIYHFKGPESAAGIHPRSGVKAPPALRDNLSTKPFPQRHFLEADQGRPFQGFTAEQWRAYREYYYRLIEAVDREVGGVVECARETLEDPLFVFTSDHGDLTGAHGLPYKGPAMYEELVRVPLVIAWPGHVRPGARSDLVSLMDLLPTLCDLAGVACPEGVDGRSLGPLLRSGRAPHGRDALFCEYYGKQSWRVPIRMVRTRRWKYVRYAKYGEELYDLRADPHEMRNLASVESAAAEKSRLSALLDRHLARTGDNFGRLTATDRSGRELPAEP